MPADLTRLVAHANSLLCHAKIGDFPGALNGLQLENSGRVTRIAAAVDANLLTIGAAIKARADLLVVHHGIGWNPLCPVTGNRHRWLSDAIRGNLAIYSSHLPLDAHPQLGNNALLAKAIGLRQARPFFEEKGTLIGRTGNWKGTRQALVRQVASVLGSTALLIPAGPAQIQRVGIVTGGAGNELARAAASGIDTFITGEGNHWTFGVAHELGLNVIYGGHYLTETFGVKALATHLSSKFRLPWSFLDVPTGL